jgi:hypothetical protein
MTLQQSAGYAPHLENTTFHAWGSRYAFKSKPLPMSTDELCRFNSKLYKVSYYRVSNM